jgi:hypothetical protein
MEKYFFFHFSVNKNTISLCLSLSLSLLLLSYQKEKEKNGLRYPSLYLFHFDLYFFFQHGLKRLQQLGKKIKSIYIYGQQNDEVSLYDCLVISTIQLRYQPDRVCLV